MFAASSTVVVSRNVEMSPLPTVVSSTGAAVGPSSFLPFFVLLAWPFRATRSPAATMATIARAIAPMIKGRRDRRGTSMGNLQARGIWGMRRPRPYAPATC